MEPIKNSQISNLTVNKFEILIKATKSINIYFDGKTNLMNINYSHENLYIYTYI